MKPPPPSPGLLLPLPNGFCRGHPVKGLELAEGPGHMLSPPPLSLGSRVVHHDRGIHPVLIGLDPLFKESVDHIAILDASFVAIKLILTLCIEMDSKMTCHQLIQIAVLFALGRLEDWLRTRRAWECR